MCMTDEESGGSLRNHGELRGPQTHRRWVAALAGLLKTLHGGLHPEHSLSLLSARSWGIPRTVAGMPACTCSPAILLPCSQPAAPRQRV